MNNEDGLLELRNQLDALDNKLLELINERMHVVHKVGALKAKSGGAIYRPEREKAIIDRLEKINKENNGLLNRSAIEALFLEIFAISRNIELPENIAYLGRYREPLQLIGNVLRRALISALSAGA